MKKLYEVAWVRFNFLAVWFGQFDGEERQIPTLGKRRDEINKMKERDRERKKCVGKRKKPLESKKFDRQIKRNKRTSN